MNGVLPAARVGGSHSLMAPILRALPLLVLLSLLGCSPEPLHIAVLMPRPMDPGVQTSGSPSLEWALETVNRAGGVSGRPLALDYFDPTAEQLAEIAAQVAKDERYVAAIGPGSSQAMADVAETFLSAKKPLLSYTSAAADLLRAYGGTGVLWRTRQSDIAQTELLLRFAQEQGAARPALLSTLDLEGSTFFSWFGFFARELGFPEEAIHIGTLKAGERCDQVVMAALKTRPDMLFVAASTPEMLQCVTRALPPVRPRVVVADTGLDPYELTRTGLVGIEGFSASGDERYEGAFRARYGAAARVPPHGASEYDAVLLLAYGLQVAQGQGGAALIEGLKAAVDGREAGAEDWDEASVRANLTSLSQGRRPALRGATGDLRFEPMLYMDLATSKLSHFRVNADGLTFDRRYFTGDASFLVSGGVLASASRGRGSLVTDSGWTPTSERTDTWALIAALSSGWSNYRHQADALRQYQLLRKGGVPDDHIILIVADDLATAATNLAPGTVRNQPGGEDLYKGATIDYRLSLSAAELLDVIRGRPGPRTPHVISATAGSNLYIYLSGHGGSTGMPVGAKTAEDGLEGGEDVLSPDLLRQALCTLRSEGRLRRGLVVIESCFAGVFGEAASGGLEKGCTEGAQIGPLNGVLLMSAANSREVSYAGSYDRELSAWVNDAFSNQLATHATAAPSVNLAELYADVYLRVPGSHASLYNTAAAGRITAVPLGEFMQR